MKIAMLVLATLGYYVMLFFLNKRRKAAIEKNAITVLGDTINLDVTEEATETDLLGEVKNLDSETLSELTTLLDADDELASNLTNMIEDTEVEEASSAPSTIPNKEIEVEVQDAPIEESDIDGLMSEIISKPL